MDPTTMTTQTHMGLETNRLVTGPQTVMTTTTLLRTDPAIRNPATAPMITTLRILMDRETGPLVTRIRDTDPRTMTIILMGPATNRLDMAPRIATTIPAIPMAQATNLLGMDPQTAITIPAILTVQVTNRLDTALQTVTTTPVTHTAQTKSLGLAATMTTRTPMARATNNPQAMAPRAATTTPAGRMVQAIKARPATETTTTIRMAPATKNHRADMDLPTATTMTIIRELMEAQAGVMMITRWISTEFHSRVHSSMPRYILVLPGAT